MNSKYKNKAKMNIPMCLACILLCLTMFSFYLLGGLYAKYTTSASGDDSARVAKVGELTIEETGDFISGNSNTMVVAPGVPLTKDAKVSYTAGELAMYVFVKVDVSNNWTVAGEQKDRYIIKVTYGTSKNLMSWNMNLKAANNQIAWEYLSTEDGAYIYYQKLAPNDKLDKCPIIASGGEITVASNISYDVFASALTNGTTGTYINFSAYAVQASGTDTPAQAWARVR